MSPSPEIQGLRLSSTNEVILSKNDKAKGKNLRGKNKCGKKGKTGRVTRERK